MICSTCLTEKLFFWQIHGDAKLLNVCLYVHIWNAWNFLRDFPLSDHVSTLCKGCKTHNVLINLGEAVILGRRIFFSLLYALIAVGVRHLACKKTFHLIAVVKLSLRYEKKYHHHVYLYILLNILVERRFWYILEV